MSRADLLVDLVRAGRSGDHVKLTDAAARYIAHERDSGHHGTARRLSAALHGGEPLTARPIPRMLDSRLSHLLFSLVPIRRLQDMILPEHAREVVQELIDEQQQAPLLARVGERPRHKLMLIGPPGNGKTTLAEAVATELDCSLLVVRYDGLIGSFLGETAKRLQTIFDHARQQRCVLFFDEFDVVGKARGDTQEAGEIKRLVSTLLLQVDKLPAHTVLVVASNHATLLDRAAWRRFEVRLALPQPTPEQLCGYLTAFCRKTALDMGGSLAEIVREAGLDSFSAAEDFCLQVYRRAVLENQIADPGGIVESTIHQWREGRAGPG